MSLPTDGGPDEHDGERSLIEDFGMYIGRTMGWPPMAGRAAGVLMLSETPLTLTQLQEVLNASKGSVSETTRTLITSGTVERFKEAGSRQFVYRWRDDAWIGCLQHQLDQTTQLLAMAENNYDRGETFSPTQQERLKQMRDYYRFIVRRLDDLLTEYTAQWQQDRSDRTEARG